MTKKERKFLILACAIIACLSNCRNRVANEEDNLIARSPRDSIHLVGEDWEALYSNESKEVFDSAEKWLSNRYTFIYSKQEEYIPFIPSVLMRSAVALKDPYFYRYSDSSISVKLISKIATDLNVTQSPTGNLDSLVDLIDKRLPSISLPLIEDQIWDHRSYKVVVNKKISSKYYGIKSDLSEKHINKIKDIYSSDFEDSISSYNRSIKYINSINNDKTQVSLLFKILVLNIDNRKEFDSISKLIIGKCYENTNIPNHEKAGYILGIAKLRASFQPYDDPFRENPSEEIFRLLNIAEGYVSLSENDGSYLFKIRYIQFLYFLDTKGEWEESYLPLAFSSTSKFEKKYWKTTDLEYIQYGINEVQYKVRKLMKVLQNREFINYRELLDITTSLYIIDLEVQLIPIEQRDEVTISALLVLHECFRLNLNLEKALDCLYKVLQIQLTSENQVLLFQSPKTVRLIELALKDMGIYNKETDINVTLHPYDRIDYPDATQTDSFIFQIPRDSRLWTDSHYDTLKRKLKTDSLECGCPANKGELEKAFQLYTEHSLRNVLKKIGMNEALNGNSELAYYFLSKSESLVIMPDSYNEPAPSVFKDAGIKTTVASVNTDKNRLIARRNSILLLALLSIIIGLLTVIAFYQRRKAIKGKEHAQFLEAKERIHSKTMSQLAHLAPDIQLILGEKIENNCIQLEEIASRSEFSIDNKQLSQILSDENMISSQVKTLSQKLREIFLKSPDSPIEFKDELQLVLDLMNIRYQDNHPLSEELTRVKNASISNLFFPPFIIFNLVANAYKHGQITQRDRFGNFGVLDIDGKLINNFWSISFENDCPPLGSSDNRNGTGLDYVKYILREWNGRNTPVNFEAIQTQNENGFWKYKVVFNIKNEADENPPC